MLMTRNTRPFARRYANGQTKNEQAPSQPSVATQRPRPQCTHMSMDRLRGNVSCDQCGQPSPMGWLYVCTQDDTSCIQHTFEQPKVDQAMARNDLPNRVERKDLVTLGLSPSILAQYDAGMYTPSQLVILVQQKRNVLATIQETVQSSKDRRPSSTVSVNGREKRNSLSQTHSLGVPHKRDLSAATKRASSETPSVNVASDRSNRDSTHSLSRPNGPPCRFKCCHACRPFLRERLPMSLEAALYDEIRPMTPGETIFLPLLDAKTVRGFGQKLPPRQLLTTMDSRDVDCAVSQSPATDANSSSTDTSSPTSCHSTTNNNTPVDEDEMEQRLHNLMTGSRADTTAPQSHAKDWSRTVSRRSGSIDMASSPAANSSASASSISLPTTPTETSCTPSCRDDHLRASPTRKSRSAFDDYPDLGIHINRNGSQDSVGSEIEVDGGVVLTEEAVMKNMPDMITQV